MQPQSFIAPMFEQKIVEPLLLEQAIAKLPRPIVFTNGCFDVLHRGHCTYLAQARNLGKSLVLAVNTDDSVRRLGKGADRPINPLGDRVSVLAALGSVSLVTWFDDDTPLALIEKIKPNILVKGGDWAIDKIIGAKFVQDHGGVVLSIPIMYQRSTTKMIDKIRKANGGDA